MKKISILFVLLAVIFIGFTLWWRNGIGAVSPQDTSARVFVIPKGEAVRSIGNSLKEQGFIKDPVVFFLYVKMNNLERNIQAGSFKISPSMTLVEIIQTFKSGSEDIWITVPEGYRAAEVAEVLEKSLETYDSSWIEEIENEEGYLFPDTYLIPKDADIATVISIFRNTFNSKIEEAGFSPDDPNLSDVVIIASLIEREAITDEEKPMIASVINNRLNDNMALDIDATLQYIKGKDSTGKWWSVPLAADKQLNSPYNTYKYPGIPPGPISNPGIEAIKAAANPAESDYYFYIHDKDGNVHFAKSLAEHNRNIERYLN